MGHWTPTGIEPTDYDDDDWKITRDELIDLHAQMNSLQHYRNTQRPQNDRVVKKQTSFAGSQTYRRIQITIRKSEVSCNSIDKSIRRSSRYGMHVIGNTNFQGRQSWGGW